MKYYYLITSLPEIGFNSRKLPVHRDEFEKLVLESLMPDDLKLFGMLKRGIVDCIKHRCRNAFLHGYFTFEQDLRNFVIGINMRMLQRDTVNYIIGSDDFVSESIRHSSLPDFGLARELPYAVKVAELIGNQKFLELEQYIDRLKFKTIDELNKFNYFTIEQVLGYSIKLEILERWAYLSRDRGRESLEKLSKKNIVQKEYYQFIDRRHN